jgi:hypothetical protein
LGIAIANEDGMNIICFAAALLGLVPAGLSQSKGEMAVPSIVEVQQKAVEYARLDPGEISKWKKNSKLQAFVPQLQFEYERRMRDYVDVNVNDQVYVGSGGSVVGPDEGQFTYNNDINNNIAVKAVWNLGEAVFNPDELNVSAEARKLAYDRQSLLAEVSKNYYARERLAGEIELAEKDMRSASADERKKMEAEVFVKRVSIKEAEAGLDALTGGWWSDERRRR